MEYCGIEILRNWKPYKLWPGILKHGEAIAETLDNCVVWTLRNWGVGNRTLQHSDIGKFGDLEIRKLGIANLGGCEFGTLGHQDIGKLN